MKQTGSIYTAITTYVNIETGEELHKRIATNKKYYIIKRTIKTVKYNETRTRATVYYTRECIPNRQGQLAFTN